LDISLEEEKFKKEFSNLQINPMINKYYKDFHDIIHNYYNYNNISVLQSKLEKCKNLNEQIKNNKYQKEQTSEYENNTIANENMSTVANEMVMYNEKNNENIEQPAINLLSENEPILIEKKENIDEKKVENTSKINPILWFEQYKNEIKSDTTLSENQIVELVNYIEQLKQEFIRLYASYASIEYNEDMINESINNTVKFVENMKSQMLNETLLEGNAKTM
jgi:hypothetical protein